MLVNLKEILSAAQKERFAVPAFNTSSNMILTGVMEECVAQNAPVIIAIHPDELSFVKDSFVKAVIDEANHAPIPVCIHLDHGASFEQVMHAIAVGYTSVMIDASRQPLEDNIAITQKVVEAAHFANVSVEAELGTIGTMDVTADGSAADQIIYTDPQVAKEFVEKTGVDALAIAIGTRHGLYPKSIRPKLRLDILDEITSLIDTPLVLHGGSDNPDEEIAAAARRGVCKINISSDIKNPFYQKCREILKDETLREPNMIYPQCIATLKEVVRHKVRLFGCDGKASLY
ncbi:MAG: ketose-bisphosphate aldolase [Clostridia bacterium]|nr:ketose-bisphosphate aldolase [Clostridia bacterium]